MRAEKYNRSSSSLPRAVEKTNRPTKYERPENNEDEDEERRRRRTGRNATKRTERDDTRRSETERSETKRNEKFEKKYQSSSFPDKYESYCNKEFQKMHDKALNQ